MWERVTYKRKSSKRKKMTITNNGFSQAKSRNNIILKKVLLTKLACPSNCPFKKIRTKIHFEGITVKRHKSGTYVERFYFYIKIKEEKIPQKRQRNVLQIWKLFKTSQHILTHKKTKKLHILLAIHLADTTLTLHVTSCYIYANETYGHIANNMLGLNYWNTWCPLNIWPIQLQRSK